MLPTIENRALGPMISPNFAQIFDWEKESAKSKFER